MANNNIAILGATSAIAIEVARLHAAEGKELFLLARNAEKLRSVCQDMEARGATVQSEIYDFDDISQHSAIAEKLDTVDTYYLFHGVLPDQEACQRDWEKTQSSFHTNFTSAVSLLARIANICEERKSGSLIVVGSVAGDRGRGSNYVYGAAKGALSLFCDGLRNRLASSNVNVLVVKPGFVDTPMTAAIDKKPAILWATPKRVALDIVSAQKKGKDTLYTPWFWRYIMLVIICIPEKLFKRLSL